MHPEAAHWFALTYHSGLTNHAIHSLLERWDPEAGQPLSRLLSMSLRDLRAARLTRQEIAGIQAAQETLEASRKALRPCEISGIQILPCNHAWYPRTLASSLGLSRPALLFCIGAPRLLRAPAVAIIGSRQASSQSLDFTAETAAALASKGIAVVSGYAEGIDRRAAHAALEAGGTTILILAQGLLTFGGGPDSVSRGISEGKVLVISAFRPRARWKTPYAMARNAMITGWCHDVVVGQTGLEGGTWEASRTALRQRKRLWVHRHEFSESGHAALEKLGGHPAPWPSESFGEWIDSLSAAARKHPAADSVKPRRWSEKQAIEMLKNGTPAEIYDATGLTGHILVRLIEEREHLTLKTLGDVGRIHGLGEAAIREIAGSFGLPMPSLSPGQETLFPDLDEIIPPRQ